MHVYFSFSALVTALVFLALGLLVFALLLRPFVAAFLKPFRREIVEEKNVALALFAGLLALALALMIAAAIH